MKEMITDGQARQSHSAGQLGTEVTICWVVEKSGRGGGGERDERKDN